LVDNPAIPVSSNKNAGYTLITAMLFDTWWLLPALQFLQPTSSHHRHIAADSAILSASLTKQVEET